MHPVFSLVLDTLGIIIFFKPVEEFFYLSNSQEFLVILGNMKRYILLVTVKSRTLVLIYLQYLVEKHVLVQCFYSFVIIIFKVSL